VTGLRLASDRIGFYGSNIRRVLSVNDRETFR
jgi:hypothetical protein